MSAFKMFGCTTIYSIMFGCTTIYSITFPKVHYFTFDSQNDQICQKKESTRKGKNLLPKEQILFFKS